MAKMMKKVEIYDIFNKLQTKIKDATRVSRNARPSGGVTALL